jgi:hypothetical protein
MLTPASKARRFSWGTSTACDESVEAGTEDIVATLKAANRTSADQPKK